VANPQPVHELNVNTRLVGIRTGLQSQRTDGLRWRLREVAQFGSALRSGRRGRGFKSPLPDQRSRGACGRLSFPCPARRALPCTPDLPRNASLAPLRWTLAERSMRRPIVEQSRALSPTSLSKSLDTVAG
jgi:hypothetical protein